MDRRRFEAMLAERAVEAGAVLARRTHFVDAHFRNGGYDVRSRDHSGRELRTWSRWVIDATGVAARFARQQGARRQMHDRMLAVARFSHLRAGFPCAQTMIEATQHGWWYGARLPDDRFLAMFVGDADEARRLASHGHESWSEGLKSTGLLGPRIDACELDEHRFVTIPIFSFLLDPPQGRQWLAVGDAASCYDPISSQGIHKALADAVDAAAHVASALGVSGTPDRDYRRRIEGRFQDYLAVRAHLYALEQRWPDAPFWLRRGHASEVARRHFGGGTGPVVPRVQTG
jgi:flavin-dependent dehydrogenase